MQPPRTSPAASAADDDDDDGGISDFKSSTSFDLVYNYTVDAKIITPRVK